MKRFLIPVLVASCLLFGCSSSDEPETAPTTTTEIAGTEAPEKAPEQELIESLWETQAARPGADIERVFHLYRQKAAAGPRNMACWDPELVKSDLCVELVEAMVLLDVPLAEIIPLLDSVELPWRLVVRNCMPQAMTLDIQAGRVNLETEDEVVVAYTVERAEGKWDRQAVDREICADPMEADTDYSDK